LVCSQLGFDPWLDAVVGVGDTAWRKPQPEFSRYMIERITANPATTLMIGDSPFDLEAGAVVGMRCAAVCTGSHDSQQLRNCDYPTIGIFDDLYELGHNLFALTPPGRREPMPTVSP
jgi:phosphoglycolate phosphatase-like HAD superfamily hydrolase